VPSDGPFRTELELNPMQQKAIGPEEHRAIESKLSKIFLELCVHAASFPLVFFSVFFHCDKGEQLRIGF
jgi:hypothetical protein